MAIWVLLILYIAKVVFYDYMAEREKIAAFCYMVWFLIRGFYRCGLLSFSFRAFLFDFDLRPFWWVPFLK